MAGLVGYGSSDEEDHMQDEEFKNADRPSSPKSQTNGHMSNGKTNGHAPTAPTPRSDAPLVGPSLGPSIDGQEVQLPEGEEQAMAPLSPYTKNRALLRDLTLPSLANYDIPPSPPGSPFENTNAKFKHFLELKKKGVHFNEKLAKSAALKNPSLTQKLMDFSDIDEAGQYATTLSGELWNPAAFPAHAFKEELAKSQQKISKQREDEKSRGQRDNVDFVPAAAEMSSRPVIPVSGGRTGQMSAAERVMAGLDRNRSNSPQVQGTKRKTRFES